MASNFFSELREKPQNRGKKKGKTHGVFPEGPGAEPEMPEKTPTWPGLPGKESNIPWGNKDKKVKQYPTSSGL